MLISKEKIEEIYRLLATGYVCMIHKKSSEILPIGDSVEDMKQFRSLHETHTDYCRIEKMSAHRSFTVMSDFILTIKNQEIKSRFLYAINKKSPFRNFKYEIGYYDELRETWFEYKNENYYLWVKEYLIELGFEVEMT